MLQELKTLVQLQELDVKILELENKKKKLPGLIERAAVGLREAEAAAEVAGAALESANRKKREADAEHQAQTEHLRKLNLRTTEIKTNKEYGAHIKEIDDCKKKISELEDRALAVMEEIESAEAQLAAKKVELEAERARFEEKKGNIEASFEDGDATLERLKGERGGLLPKLDSAVSGYYELMLKNYPDSVVVEAVSGTCTGCRMTIPPQVFNNVRKGETLVKCNYCRRILFYRDGS